jgi:hypothetical protein
MWTNHDLLNCRVQATLALLVGRLREVLVSETDGVERLGRDRTDGLLDSSLGWSQASGEAIGTATTISRGASMARANS